MSTNISRYLIQEGQTFYQTGIQLNNNGWRLFAHVPPRAVQRGEKFTDYRVNKNGTLGKRVNTDYTICFLTEQEANEWYKDRLKAVAYSLQTRLVNETHETYRQISYLNALLNLYNNLPSVPAEEQITWDSLSDGQQIYVSKFALVKSSNKIVQNLSPVFVQKIDDLHVRVVKKNSSKLGKLIKIANPSVCIFTHTEENAMHWYVTQLKQTINVLNQQNDTMTIEFTAQIEKLNSLIELYADTNV